MPSDALDQFGHHYPGPGSGEEGDETNGQENKRDRDQDWDEVYL